jgi:hypothetical protein
MQYWQILAVVSKTSIAVRADVRNIGMCVPSPFALTCE